MDSSIPNVESSGRAPTGRPWRRILAVGMLVSVAFCGGWLLGRMAPGHPKQGTRSSVHALLRVEPTEIMGFTQANESSKSDEQHRRYMGTLAGLFTSPNVLLATLKDPEVARLEAIKRQRDPKTWLAERIHVDILEGTYLMVVRADGMTPADQAIVVNAATHTFLKECMIWATTVKQKQIDKLDEYSRDLLGKMDHLREQIAKSRAAAEDDQMEPKIREQSRIAIQTAEAKLKITEESYRRALMRLEELNFGPYTGYRIALVSEAQPLAG